MIWRIYFTAGAIVIALAAAYNYHRTSKQILSNYGHKDKHGWLFWMLLFLAMANGVILYSLLRG